MERMKGTIGQMRADTGRQGQVYPKTSRHAIGDLCILKLSLWLLCAKWREQTKMDMGRPAGVKSRKRIISVWIEVTRV